VTDRPDRWRFSINWPLGEEASSDYYAWPRTSIEARSSTPPDTASPAGGGSATSFGQSLPPEHIENPFGQRGALTELMTGTRGYVATVREAPATIDDDPAIAGPDFAEFLLSACARLRRTRTPREKAR
jgi:hypothetical protein